MSAVRKVVPFRLSEEEAEIITAAVEAIERAKPHYYGVRCTLSSFVRHAAIRLAERVTDTLVLTYHEGTSLEERITAARSQLKPAARAKAATGKLRRKDGKVRASSRPVDGLERALAAERDAAARTLPMFPAPTDAEMAAAGLPVVVYTKGRGLAKTSGRRKRSSGWAEAVKRVRAKKRPRP